MRDDEEHLLTTPTPRVNLSDDEVGDMGSVAAAPARFPERSHTPEADGRSAAAEAYCPACGGSFPPDANACPRDGARLVKFKAQVDPMLGRVLDGRYEVRAALGEGGMGTVYRGHQLSVDREVAIKVIHAALASDRTSVKRFLREARLSSRLTQPSIVNVYDFGQTEDGVLYLVMELLRGHTLASELDGKQPMQVKRVAHIGLQLCDALEAAHNQGIIHRDLKPGNIIVLDEPPGRDLIKVLDFGLAKSLANESSTRVTMSNAMLGTPMYMAPEQIGGREADPRADIYALGCILFHMLTGRAPFGGDNVQVVLAAHLNDAIPSLPSHVPVGMAHTIQRMLAKDPENRIAHAAEVREVLQSAMSAPAASAPAPTPAKTPAVFESVAMEPDASLFSSKPFKTTARAVETAKSGELIAPQRSWGKLAAIVGGLIAIPVVVMLATGGSSDKAAKPEPARTESPKATNVETKATNVETKATNVETKAANPAAPPAPSDVAAASSATVPPNIATQTTALPEPVKPSSSSSSKADKPRNKSDRDKTKPTSTTTTKPASTTPTTPAVTKPADPPPPPPQPTGPSIDFYPSKKK